MVYVKIIVLKKFVPTCNIVINRYSFNKHKKGRIKNQFQIYNNLFKKITNYKDYFRLYRLFNLCNPAFHAGLYRLNNLYNVK